MRSAAHRTTKSDVRLDDIDHPTTIRENRSIHTQKCQLSRVLRFVQIIHRIKYSTMTNTQIVKQLEGDAIRLLT